MTSRLRVGRGSAGSLAALSLLVALSGCGTRDDATAWSQRDSAGVTIVENARPRETDWRLAEAPALEIRVIAANDSAPADPVSVFADRRGRVHVADQGGGASPGLLVFDEDGRFLSRTGVGGSLQAPALLWWAASYRGDSLVALDLAAKKLLVYDADGSFAREVDVPAHRRDGAFGVPGYTAGAAGPMEDGSFLTYPAGAPDRDAVEGPAWYRHDLLRLSPEGERWDTLGVFEIFQTFLGPDWPEPYPFGAVAFAVPQGNGFAFTTAEAFDLELYDSTGALRRIVRRAHAPEVVNAADLEQYQTWYLGRARAARSLDAEAEQRLTQQLAGAHHPERRPAISNLIVDDAGNLWAEDFRWVDAYESAPEPRPSNWSVFDPEGRWLADVQAPAGFLISSVSGDKVYGVQVEGGTKTVRVYPLSR